MTGRERFIDPYEHAPGAGGGEAIGGVPSREPALEIRWLDPEVGVGPPGPAAASALAAAERRELDRLRRENERLRAERKILTDAAAWLARDPARPPTRFPRP